MTELGLDETVRLLRSALPETPGGDDQESTAWPELPPTLEMSELAGTFADAVVSGLPADRIAAVMRTVEQALREGDERVKDAVATGFLERLMTEASAGRMSFEQLTDHLGPESRRYCEAWDEFTGTRTPGL